jgi:hypothetical protein
MAEVQVAARLSRGQRAAVGAAVALGLGLAAYGLAGSYQTLSGLAKRRGVPLAPSTCTCGISAHTSSWAAEQVHEHGATHLITEIAVWPFPAEAEALVTLDLPSGIRLCTLCISHKHLIPDHTQAADGTAVIRHVLANVLGHYHRMGSAKSKRLDLRCDVNVPKFH